MKTTDPTTDTPQFEMKGSVITVIVLHLKGTDTDLLHAQLEKKIGKARAFFQSAPLLIDLADINDEAQTALDLTALATTLRELGVVPVGVRNHIPTLSTTILDAGLGLLPPTKGERTTSVPETEDEEHDKPAEQREVKEAPASATGGSATMVITQPVRSGQQIIAQNSDVIVLSSVNAGGEVLAAGNIHVYGPLRGRAMAGIHGNTAARIFSLQCNPELIAIAGEYIVNDDLDPACFNQSVLVSLSRGRLRFDIAGTFSPAP